MKKYSKEELKNMIISGNYPVGAPGWIVKAIRRKRQEMNRKIAKPEKEMADFLRDSGASGKVVK